MEILKTLFFKKRVKANYRKTTLNEIRKILEEYSNKRISIAECVSNTAPLTAELIFMYSSEKTKTSVYDSVLIMITNYYVMLYMDMYTGFYAVSKNYTCNLVSSLAEEVLNETAKNQNGLKSNNSDTAIQKSRNFTKEMVEVYYRTSIEGCHRYVASSIYSSLLSEHKNPSVNRDLVEHIVRAIQAEKFLAGGFEDSKVNNIINVLDQNSQFQTAD